jgi:hypothetical protein
LSIICHWCSGIGRTVSTNEDCTVTNEIDCFSCNGIGFFEQTEVFVKLKKTEDKTNAIERAISIVENKYFKHKKSFNR